MFVNKCFVWRKRVAFWGSKEHEKTEKQLASEKEIISLWQKKIN